jgi:ABC-type nitrate/sulfonate/bicarbonate transport system substrate-binding protein
MPTSPSNIAHMPTEIAQELGLHKKYGITVKLVALNDDVNVFRAVLNRVERWMAPWRRAEI